MKLPGFNADASLTRRRSTTASRIPERRYPERLRKRRPCFRPGASGIGPASRPARMLVTAMPLATVPAKLFWTSSNGTFANPSTR